MKTRHTDTVTRVDVRIPNELYKQIQKIAIARFKAKIHHRSNKPEISPTILELIKIGIAHFDSESIKQAIDFTSTLGDERTDETAGDELKEWIEQLDSRLTAVENKLSSKSFTAPELETEGKGLNDQELAKLLGVSNMILRDYRVKGKVTGGQALAQYLEEEWAISEGLWFRKKSK